MSSAHDHGDQGRMPAGASGADATPARARSGLEEVRDSLPGLARIAASSWLHTAQWGVRASARGARRVAEAATDPRKAVELATEVGQAASAVGEIAQSLTAGVPLPKALANAAASLNGAVARIPVPEAAENPAPASPAPQATAALSLRDRGEALLNRSRDVWSTDASHPAHERILDELAPDEARILVLLARSGPQPCVDVRTGGPTGMLSPQLLASRLNMVGSRAGLRYSERMPAYLNNLLRLGLVWVSGEPLRDPHLYQVVEAQPDVLEALHSVKFARVVRKSIHLTPFGEDFCRLALIDAHTEAGSLPEHSTPPQADNPETPGT